MKHKQVLGEVELEILNIVWEKGEASVQDVVDDILRKRKTAYTSVLTMMRNLHKKGYLTYRQEGRTFIYSAAIEPDEIKHNLLKNTLEKVFKGSSVELVQHLFQSEDLSKEEIAEIKKLIKEL